MKKRVNTLALTVMMMLALLAAYANGQSDNKKLNAKTSATSAGVTPQAAPNLPVSGSGTIGRLPKWTGFGSSSSILGDSAIFEGKDGKVGIGTASPTAKLTVQGRIRGTVSGDQDEAVSGIAVGFGVGGSFKSDYGLGLRADGQDGVFAYGSAHGVIGYSVNGKGISGFTDHGIAVSGQAQSSDGVAGQFLGDVEVTGSLSKGGGSFKIDHPLDSENKFLYHSFVESPDMKNIYDGVAKLDSNGEALVEMPEWFNALNRDFRYLLTPVGAPAPGLYIAEELANNRFKVAGGAPGMKVSWQVTGIRQDAWANKHRIKVEEDKAEKERGFYLHPDAFNQPEEKSVEWARDPKLMKQMKEMRQKKQGNIQ